MGNCAVMRYISRISIIFIFFFLSACGASKPTMQPLSRSDVIVAFGDSLTFGAGAKANQSYPVQLARITGRQVVNAGVSGEETSGGLQRIRGVLNEYRPQLVILCLGGNDMLRKRNTAQIKNNLASMISIIQASGAQVFLLAAPRPSLSLSVPDFYAELGAEFNIPVDTSTLPDLLGQGDKKADTIHLNAVGYQEMAQLIAQQLREAGAL